MQFVTLVKAMALFACLSACTDDFELYTTVQSTSEAQKREWSRQIVNQISDAEFSTVFSSLTSITYGRPNLSGVAKRFARRTGTAYSESTGAVVLIFEINRVQGIVTGGPWRDYEITATFVRSGGENRGNEVLRRGRATKECDTNLSNRFFPCNQAFFETLAEAAIFSSIGFRRDE